MEENEEKKPNDGNVVEEKKPTNGMAIASLVFGIITLVLMLLSWSVVGGIIGIITGIVGMVLGIVSVKKAKTGMGMAGLVTSIIGLVMCIIFTIGCVACGIGVFKTVNEGKISDDTVQEAADELAKESDKLVVREALNLSITACQAEYYTDHFAGSSQNTGATIGQLVTKMEDEGYTIFDENKNRCYSYYTEPIADSTIYVSVKDGTTPAYKAVISSSRTITSFDVVE